MRVEDGVRPQRRVGGGRPHATASLIRRPLLLADGRGRGVDALQEECKHPSPRSSSHRPLYVKPSQKRCTVASESV